jgi:hypothetical protein
MEVFIPDEFLVKPTLRTLRLISSLLLVCASCLGAGTSYPAEIENLFTQHCYDCHDGDIAKGGLNLETLGFSPTDHANFKTWIRILDRVHDGEMPPAKKARPDASPLLAFRARLGHALHESDRKEKARSGNVHVRRLTR